MAFIVGGLLIGAGASVAGAAIGAKGAKDAAKTAAKGSQADLAYQKEGRDLARGDAAYGRQAGATALDAMMSKTGLGLTNFGASEQGRQAEESDTSVSGSDYLGVFGKTLGNKGRKKLARYQSLNPYTSGYGDQQYIDDFQATLGREGQKKFNKFSQNNPFASAATAAPTAGVSPEFQRELDRASGKGYYTAEERSAAISRHQNEVNPFGRAYGGNTRPNNSYNINEMGPENAYRGGSYTRNPNPMTIGGQTGYVQPNIQGMAYGGFMADDPRSNAIMGGGMPQQPTGGYAKPEQGLVGNPPSPTPTIQPNAPPGENPGGVEGGYNFQTDPGYNFRFNEGQRALDRGAGAAGGLLSGGYARKSQRYGQDYASGEYQNVYNRIANIAGMGQTAAGQSGQYAMYGGGGMGNAASNAANASAYGQVGAGNAYANAANQISQMPWDNILGGGQTTNTGPPGQAFGGWDDYQFPPIQ